MTNKNEAIKMLQELQHNISIVTNEDEETVHPLNMEVQAIINFIQRML
jgi:hypothetical protein